jgi:hypothetical protein
VLKILDRYFNIEISPSSNFVDNSHFVIELSFEGKTQPMAVLNPVLFRQRSCGLWPFEVKQALGIMVFSIITQSSSFF